MARGNFIMKFYNKLLLIILILFFLGSCSSPKEVSKKNSKGLSIEELSIACSRDDSERCNQLGTVYVQKKLEKDEYLGLAKESYQKSCLLKNGKGCYQAGVLFSLDHTKESVKEAFKFHQKGCELEHGMSCLMLGLIYEQQLKRPKQAQRYFQKSCKTGNYTGCSMVKGQKKKIKTYERKNNFSGFLSTGASMINQAPGFVLGGGFLYEDLKTRDAFYIFYASIKLLPYEEEMVWMPHIEARLFNFGLGVSVKISEDDISKPILNSYLSLPVLLYGFDFNFFGNRILPRGIFYWRCYWEKDYGFFNELGIMIDFYKFFTTRG